MIYPSKEVLQELLELSQDGDIQNILELAEQISASDEKLNLFPSNLRSLLVISNSNVWKLLLNNISINFS